jgi:hypothetical protein
MTIEPAPEPIIVNAEPGADQWAAAFRQLLLVAAGIATVFGWRHLAGDASGLLAIAAPAGGLVAFVIGQIKTRHSAQKMAAMADALPDRIAQVK